MAQAASPSLLSDGQVVKSLTSPMSLPNKQHDLSDPEDIAGDDKFLLRLAHRNIATSGLLSGTTSLGKLATVGQTPTKGN